MSEARTPPHEKHKTNKERSISLFTARHLTDQSQITDQHPPIMSALVHCLAHFCRLHCSRKGLSYWKYSQFNKTFTLCQHHLSCLILCLTPISSTSLRNETVRASLTVWLMPPLLSHEVIYVLPGTSPITTRPKSIGPPYYLTVPASNRIDMSPQLAGDFTGR